jgi:hypothetical protein
VRRDAHVFARTSPVFRTASLHQVYSDEKVANRDIRVWHGATEKGP